MKLWRQLRWRVVGSHMIVVLTGVMILLLTSQAILASLVPSLIRSNLAVINPTGSVTTIEQVGDTLLIAFRNTVVISLLVAALGAIIAGSVTSLWLTRGIIDPLQQIAQGSRRIANGRYDERVSVPDSTELAAVATSFNQMAEALAHIEEQRVVLIGNVSHELRTPLTGIEGYLEGLMDGVMPNDVETFAPMYQEVRRLRRLVDDLQVLSRVEAGQVPLRLETFDLIPIIQRVVSHLQPQAVGQDLTITTKLPATTNVYADPDRTTQILTNLLGNAIRYTPEGGHITLSVQPQATSVQIAVQDTGSGIPASDLPYIFERFYRVDRSRARSSGGSGIGLTISRHLAWAMGGDLTATSPGSGQGSTFHLELPAGR